MSIRHIASCSIKFTLFVTCDINPFSGLCVGVPRSAPEVAGGWGLHIADSIRVSPAGDRGGVQGRGGGGGARVQARVPLQETVSPTQAAGGH